MRPKIPPYLDGEIDEIYEEAGYGSKTEFIKDAIRVHVERVKDES
ncbi:MAG: hypothetical protein J07AB43_02700 [Candidatus Nanosalina sp. J07AB43]|jgi:hypothetical protein|nr:MAG: hypothetical protein J07AB43_02700 [Candidatus Nanosalina sp. J07AB43]